jgi:acetyl-CoA carboxylase biotin carboxyl carrier protein
MEIKKIKKLIELIQQSDLSEIEIQEGEESVRLSRQNRAVAAEPAQHAAAGPPPQHHTFINEPVHHSTPQYHANTGAGSEATTTEQQQTQGHEVRSPMVGTVYLAPSPGEKPFVEVGQNVSQGDTLCIVEAMKMFNPIEADRSGVISARLVENSSPVEYNQPLFIISED